MAASKAPEHKPGGAGASGPKAMKSAKPSDGLALDAMQGIKARHAANGKSGKTGRTGRDVILEPEKNNDEFAKGTVANPEELDKIREDGNQDGMGEETLVYGDGYFEKEKPGLEDGVSLRETIDPDKTEPNYNYDIDPMTGSAPERKVGRTNNYTVKGKRDTFEIGEM